MKFEISIDATPEEMRRFLGLPDMTQIHQAWTDKMLQGADPEAWQKMSQAWMANINGANDGMAAWQKMMSAGFSGWPNMSSDTPKK